MALVGIQAGEAACCCWAGRALSKLRSAGERILPQRRGALLPPPLPVTTTTGYGIAIVVQLLKLKMPAKELVNPCVDCGDAEFAVNLRNRRLCKYVVA